MRRHGLADEQLETLRDLVGCWGIGGFVLIGARALSCFVPLTWSQTEDLDVSVMVSMEEYPAGLDDLPGWRTDGAITQRWYSRSGVRVDVLPSGRDGRAEDAFQWPGEDRTFSRVGLRLASDFAIEVGFDDELSVHVAPVSVVCVLKMIAYLDRPQERSRDLLDIAHLLADYPDLERRFELEGVYERGLDYDQAGPFTLGQEIQALGLSATEHDSVDRFLVCVETDEVVASRMAQEAGTGRSRVDMLRLVQALRLGLLRPPGE